MIYQITSKLHFRAKKLNLLNINILNNYLYDLNPQFSCMYMSNTMTNLLKCFDQTKGFDFNQPETGLHVFVEVEEMID